jgi:hypothetical protein
MMHESRMHLTEEELHDAAAGDQPAAADARAGRHLARCTTCRAEVERIRGLLELAAALPREIDPPGDLWPDIHGRIRKRDASRIGGRPGVAAGWTRILRDGRWLAAAAVLLIVASSTMTVLVMRSTSEAGPEEVSATTDDRDTAVAASFRADDYDRMDRDLAALLASERMKLQPETMRKVERNLAIIDGAIAEIREALQDDPGNEALHRLLKASYGQKAALVRQVTQT